MTSAKNKFSVKELTGIVISIALALAFLLFAFRGVDFDSFLLSLQNISLGWSFLFFVMILLGHYVRALRWKVMLEPIKENCKISNLYGALFVGYGMNSIIPRLGEVSRAVYLGYTENISRSSLFGTVIVERVVDIIFFGLAVVVSAFLFTGNIYDAFVWLKTALYFGTVIILLIIAFLILSIKLKEKFYSIIIKIFSYFSKSGGVKAKEIFEKLIEGFSILKTVKQFVMIIFLSAIIMSIYGFNSYIGLLMLGMEEYHAVSLAMGWIVMSISAIGIVIPTPGGIGSYHTITKSVLVNLYSFNNEISFAYATLTHGIAYIVHLLGAAVSVLLLRHKNKNVKADSFFKLENNE